MLQARLESETMNATPEKFPNTQSAISTFASPARYATDSVCCRKKLQNVAVDAPDNQATEPPAEAADS
jgi:hypothetical protein